MVEMCCREMDGWDEEYVRNINDELDCVRVKRYFVREYVRVGCDGEPSVCREWDGCE